MSEYGQGHSGVWHGIAGEPYYRLYFAPCHELQYCAAKDGLAMSCKKLC